MSEIPRPARRYFRVVGKGGERAVMNESRPPFSRPFVIRAPFPVIPAPFTVIPAKAGIHSVANTPLERPRAQYTRRTVIPPPFPISPNLSLRLRAFAPLR